MAYTDLNVNLVHDAPKPDPLEDPDAYDAYLRELDRHRGKAELIIAKNRHGERAVCTVGFDGPRMKFHDLQGEAK